MARNKQIDGEADESESGSYGGSEAKRKKNKGKSSTNRANTNSHNDRNRRDAESATILDLGVYTDAANMAIQNMLATENAMKNLAYLYATHVESIEQISEIEERCNRLEQDCREKDELIKDHDTTINTLWGKTHVQEQQVEEERNTLAEQRRKFEEEMEKKEKRFEVKEAEQANKTQKELERLRGVLEEEFKDYEQKLKCDVQKQEDESKQRLAKLEEEKKTLAERVETLSKEKDKHTKKITQAKDDYDDLMRTKDSYKEDARKLEKRLKAMENEFVLNLQPAEFYVEEFARIHRTIEQISTQYFKELSTENINATRERLITADSGFNSIPISNSPESEALRMARAQIIISSSLIDIIWQPFSSEKTAPYPEVISVLSDISAELAKSSHGSSSGPRTAGIWRALTMRALQSLSPTPLPPSSTSQANLPLLSRAERLVNKVLLILLPLVAPSKEPYLRDDLLSLANSAISVWSSVQTAELQLLVSSSLDSAQRNEWRSLVFDPPPTDCVADDIVYSTHPRVFTLFPRITALRSPVPAEAPTGLPGSWPEHDQEPRMIETCIHPGTGLPEWSVLVLKGKAEEEDRKERVEEERIQDELAALEKQKRELEARGGRNGQHSRNGSIAGSASGPTSPTAQWMSRRRTGELD